MPIRGGWYIPQRVLLTEFRGDIADEEFVTASGHPAIVPEMEASPAPLIHFIFDSQQVTQMPGLRVASQTPLARHPKVGWVIIIQSKTNPAFRMISSLLAQITRLRSRFVDSETGAIEFLQYIDPTLPPFPHRDEIEWFNHVNWQD